MKPKAVELIPFAQILGGTDTNNFHNPFPWFEKKRKESPIYFHEETGTWNAFQYEDVKRLADDKEKFSVVFPQMPGNTLKNSIIALDPPRHTQIRSIVSHAFTPRVMKEWEPRILEITEQLLNSVSGSEEIDIVKDFSYPLPMVVIAEMLGVPSQNMDKFKEWSDILVGSPKSSRKEDVDENINIRLKTDEALAEFFHEIIEEKRGDLGNDIISILIKAGEEGVKISEEDLIPFCRLLLVAGNETTTNLIANAVYCLLENPDVYKELRSDLSLVPQMMEETLRYRGPAHILRRIVAQDTELNGQRLRKGEIVIGWLASANRDESKFENASKYDIHRSPNRHIAFGHGIHFCLGAPLARLEANIAITEIIERYSSISFSKDFTIDPVKNGAVLGFNSLLVRVSQ
ncbi:cytochrome P450 [Paenibacillus agricola]|uniref:Cytochrome P450 n=1 Tax=Paenibacillus agricola TaxID=2716264 RepID=A0ABX0J9G5_9BACL|nr:cytochrome P450 [Paenibacillus agricola]NHN33065.1 cytochrome P450 [Paenibacillus agricola]